MVSPEGNRDVATHLEVFVWNSSLDEEDAALYVLKVDVWPTNTLSDKLLYNTSYDENVAGFHTVVSGKGM